MAYSQEQRADIQERICTLVAKGRSLNRVLAEEPGMPDHATICRWLGADASFCEHYTRAREAQADHYADEIADIADTEPDPNKARVRIDARKWIAGKMKPKVYGDRLQLDANVEVALSDSQLESRLAKLLGKTGAVVSSSGEGTPEGET